MVAATGLGRVDPNTLLQLQRSIGNQGVQRLLHFYGSKVRGAPVIQRSRYDDIKLSSDDFWAHIRTRTKVSLALWLTNLDREVNQFETDMRSEDESGGSFSLDTFVNMANDLTGLLRGATGPFAAAAISLGKGLFDAMSKEASGGSVSLEDFLASFRATNTKISGEIDNHPQSVDLFKRLSQMEAEDARVRDRTAHRSAKIAELDGIVETLVTNSPAELRRRLIIDWVAASTDTWDRDWGGKDAGTITYWVREAGSHVRAGPWVLEEKPFVDDASRAQGTIKALRRAFGASTPIYDLPIQCNLNIIVGAPAGAKVAKYYRPALSITKASNENHAFGKWKAENDVRISGVPALYVYLNDPPSVKPTLADLETD